MLTAVSTGLDRTDIRPLVRRARCLRYANCPRGTIFSSVGTVSGIMLSEFIVMKDDNTIVFLRPESVSHWEIKCGPRGYPTIAALIAAEEAKMAAARKGSRQ